MEKELFDSARAFRYYSSKIEAEIKANPELIKEVEDLIKEVIDKHLLSYVHVRVEDLKSCPKNVDIARRLLVYEFRSRGFHAEETYSTSDIAYVYISWIEE